MYDIRIWKQLPLKNAITRPRLKCIKRCFELSQLSCPLIFDNPESINNSNMLTFDYTCQLAEGQIGHNWCGQGWVLGGLAQLGYLTTHICVSMSYIEGGTVYEVVYRQVRLRPH